MPASGLRTRHAGGASGEGEGALQPTASFDQFLNSKIDRFHWPAAVLISMGLIALLAQASPIQIVPVPGVLRGGGLGSGTRGGGQAAAAATQPAAAAAAAAGAGAGGVMEPRNEFEQQLYGCRSLKSGPIPYVDTSASLRALDSHTPQQRQQAEAFAAAVAACQGFECLRRANELPRAPGQFHFPHFFVIGFPKCATTSIYCHLIQHPAVQHPKEKESHWLSQQCGQRSLACPADSQQHYIQEILNMPEAAAAKFTKAAFEGSTHYVLESEWMPQQLAATFPWLRVVVSLRDPISQAIAMHLHNVMHDRDSNCTRGTDSIYHCIRKALKPGSRSHYPSKIVEWMKHFPQQQLHFMQYENVTQPETMGGELTRLKSFLGLDPALPSSQLPLTNYKHVHTGHGPDALGRYWILKRWELEHLVSIARNNTQETVELLRQHGMAGRQQLEQWATAWEHVWEENLGRCEEGRAAPCRVVVS